MAHTGLDLASLYFTGEYSDCVLISQEGEELRGHRIVIGQHANFKALIDSAPGPDRRIQFSEPTKVLQRVLEWMYGVEWPSRIGDATTARVGVELMNIMGTCRAAEHASVVNICYLTCAY